jgi:hypothetical protein
MRFPKHISRTPVLFVCALACGTGWLRAQTVTTWWPDPLTGLMWTGQARYHLDWQRGPTYCSSLKLGGYSDWRLPSADEINAIYHCESPQFQCHDIAPNGMVPGGPVSTVGKYIYRGNLPILCTRPMEDDLLQLAKDAQVKVTVPDVLTLKAWVPLTKAKFAYQLGQFQDAIKQAESSLAIKPDFATADWAIGISYGRLGQWDLAVSDLKAALKIDKNNDDFKSAVKWANEGQRAAKSGKAPKAPPPLWN